MINYRIPDAFARSKDPNPKAPALKMAITMGSKVQSANGSWRSILQKDGVDLGTGVEWKASELTTMPWQPN